MVFGHKVEERNQVIEKAQADFLNMHFRIMTTTYWSVLNTNWSMTLGSPSLNRTTTTLKQKSCGETSSMTLTTSTNKWINFCKLTDSEVAKNRELGLFYMSDEKYSPMHKCKNKQL